MQKNTNSRIQILIHLSEARIRGSGSVPKCHGSATLTSSHGIASLQCFIFLIIVKGITIVRIFDRILKFSGKM
jgi:hypothetical protein